jgi:hypothetical protein
MRNGPSAHDGDRWPSAHHPYGDDGVNGPGPYRPGRRNEPRDVPAGRPDVPFGPDISWPNGFRRMDTESQRLLESGFARPGSAPPVTDDYGYGDPGYSDPTYDGPRSGSARPGGFPPAGRAGYPGSAADFREPLRPHPGAGADGYPATGAQEALRTTGPQPAARWDIGREPGTAPSYPEQWYGHPRLDDPRPAPDPRLTGLRYDELRYDDAPSAESGYDEPLDDESWFRELRRSAPSYPQQPGAQPGADRRGGEAGGPGFGARARTAQPGPFPQAPGYGPGLGGADPQGRRGPQGPRMSAEAGPGSRPSSGPQDLASFLGAPTAQVGVLSPPAGRRLEETAAPAAAPVAVTGPQQIVPGAGQVTAPAVRPGHGLDGPEITSSWPSQPQADELENFDEFWSADDGSGFDGLFPGEDDARPRRGLGRLRAGGRRTGRRRGRSNDHRLWLALGGVLVAAVAAIVGILKFEFPSHSGGPVHTMQTPDKIGGYVRTVDMEKTTKVSELRAEVIKMSSGQASDVKSAVYELGNSAAGNTEQIVMFIGGHLANAAPASSISSFRQNFASATVVSAGSLGGQAACVQEAGGTPDAVAMCVWFDNDSFGEIVSPTMNAGALAQVMRTMRPSLEVVVPK